MCTLKILTAVVSKTCIILFTSVMPSFCYQINQILNATGHVSVTVLKDNLTWVQMLSMNFLHDLDLLLNKIPVS